MFAPRWFMRIKSGASCQSTLFSTKPANIQNRSFETNKKQLAQIYTQCFLHLPFYFSVTTNDARLFYLTQRIRGWEKCNCSPLRADNHDNKSSYNSDSTEGGHKKLRPKTFYIIEHKAYIDNKSPLEHFSVVFKATSWNEHTVNTMSRDDLAPLYSSDSLTATLYY